MGLQAELIKGSGGVFEITLDGAPVFSKKREHRFPEPGEVARLLMERVGAGRS
jgi:selT/selW/selH-like putative selenoprotein